MELLNPETMDSNDVDIKARELLGSELATSGITCTVTIWTGEGNAYLDDETMYGKLADHFNRMAEEKTGNATTSYTNYDKSQLDEALFSRYLTHFEEVENELEKQTMQSTPIAKHPGMSILTWRTGHGWYGCVAGTHDGNYVEGDDQGPFEERSDAKDAALGDEEE